MTTIRRLAAILAADVAGYSRLIGADEGGTLQALKAIRAELIDPTIAAHNGRLVKTTGDGLLVEFGSVVDALRCASNVRAGMAERNPAVPNDRRIEFRIGINMGDIVVEDGDIFGDGVNVAARLEGLAEPGGICVSARVQEDVAGKLDLAFEDMGEQVLKNIARPVRAYRVATGAVSATAQATPALALPDKPSIAVLPFANISGDREQEYFADGMVEEITTAIARMPWLFVIARNSSFTYKGKAVDVRQVARELGVRYVLEGSVRKAGSRVRITGQLIDTTTGAHIWADRFDGALDDIFELQDQVASSVVGAIEPRLRQSEIDRAARKATENLDAYDLYLPALAQSHTQAYSRESPQSNSNTGTGACERSFIPASHGFDRLVPSPTGRSGLAAARRRGDRRMPAVGKAGDRGWEGRPRHSLDGGHNHRAPCWRPFCWRSNGRARARAQCKLRPCVAPERLRALCIEPTGACDRRSTSRNASQSVRSTRFPIHPGSRLCPHAGQTI